MLSLSRLVGESIFVGPIQIKIQKLRGSRITVGIEAPREFLIRREELLSLEAGVRTIAIENRRPPAA